MPAIMNMEKNTKSAPRVNFTLQNIKYTSYMNKKKISYRLF